MFTYCVRDSCSIVVGPGLGVVSVQGNASTWAAGEVTSRPPSGPFFPAALRVPAPPASPIVPVHAAVPAIHAPARTSAPTVARRARFRRERARSPGDV